jgi:lambda family phage portal protein
MALLDAMASFFGRRQDAAALLDAPAPPPPPVQQPPRRQQRFGYDGAKRNRLNYDWTAGNSGANAEVFTALSTLRARCSDLARNNPHAAKALEAVSASVVSTGIRPRTENARLQALWDLWVEECSTDTDLDFYGLQSLAVRSWLERGDMCARRRWRRLEDGLAVPLQVELLEGDFIDHQKNGQSPGGQPITQGVEFDLIGRRAAYWLFRTHPGETSFVPGAGGSSVRIAAADVAHLYRATRAGQVRGVPMLAAVIQALRDLGQYQASERVRKRSQAGIVGFITPADDATYDEEGTDNVGVYAQDSDGNALDDVEPGSLVVLRNGKMVTLSQPASDAGYKDFVYVQLMAIAAGCILPYEILAGDLSQVNYSSIRLGLVEYQRFVKILQTQIVIPLFCRRVWKWFVEAAILAGEIPPGTYPCKWILPEREEIDRQTAVDAASKAVRCGFTSRQDEVTAAGKDPDEVLAEIVADLEALDAAGITLDTDPRHPESGPLQPVAADPADTTPQD